MKKTNFRFQFGKILNYFICCFLFLSFGNAINAQTQISFCGSPNNDLYKILRNEGIIINQYDDIDRAIKETPGGSGLIVVADDYPAKKVSVSIQFYELVKKKKIRLYIEYPEVIPGKTIGEKIHVGKLERGVISSDFFGTGLPSMSLLSLNDCHIMVVKDENPLISFARVAGFDKATYGLTDTEVFPLLFKNGNMMIATSALSNFINGRYGPFTSWKIIWNHILSWIVDDKLLNFATWHADPQPSFPAAGVLPPNAGFDAVRKGAEWIYKGRLLVHPEWNELFLKYQGNGDFPIGPPLESKYFAGDGCLGVLEGHMSDIQYDGKQQFRYWSRADIQGETAFLLASSGDLLNNQKYRKTSENLLDYLFYTGNFRKDARSIRDSSVYGLIGWSVTHPGIFYGDDNARCILGTIGASAFLKNERWNRFIVENIMANFRTTSTNGFQGWRLEQKDIQANGWQFYYNRDLVYVAPHYESWMWACYLWLYHKTGYKPLLVKAKNAITKTMEAYPDKWTWSNGIQEERGRMLLPLAWLVRVEDTPEHRKWLDIVVSKIIENQQPSGAIREELGDSKMGWYGKTLSNSKYGTTEAPLIEANGNPVSDMLYTCNFTFFGLNEAAKATGNPEYIEALKKLSDFLIRIQVKSERHPDLDGAWFRAFDYERWDYWASNADAGWGAWSTLTGWIQSWIVGTQVLIENNQSFWDATENLDVKKDLEECMWMLDIKSESINKQ